MHSSPKKSTSETCRSWLTSVVEVSQGELSVCPINSFVYAAGRKTHTQGSRTIGWLDCTLTISRKELLRFVFV